LRCRVGIVIPRAAAATVLALALTTSPSALALGAIVTSPPGASSVVSVRQAVAAAGGRTVRWGSVEVRGTASAMAWIIPAGQGAALDLASDAWLEALEAASAPRVVPPDITPPCGIPGGIEVEGDFTHAATATPGIVGVAADRASLDAALAASGLAVTSDLAPSIDASLTAGNAMVVLVYPEISTDTITRTVRVADTSPPTFALALVEAGSSPVSVTAFAFGAGSVAVGEQPPLSINAADVVWLSNGTSSYPSVRDTLLATYPGAWLFETRGHDIVFDGVPVPGGTATPALTSSYYFGAASYGDATDAPDSCTGDANAIAQSGSSVAPACPVGSLARVGPTSSPCQEMVGAGEIDPSVLRCGGIADDLAMALSGLSPAQTWITRVRTSLAPWTPGRDSSVTAGTAAGPYGPVVTASGYAEPCTAPASSTGNTGTGSGSSSTGSSGANDQGSTGGGNVVVGVTAGAQTASVVADSSDGCDGDSSDDGDSCSGDSSGSSGEDAGGGGCSGSSDPSSSGGGCDVAPHRSHSSRTALLLVGLAAFARRRTRTSHRSKQTSLPEAQ
jgi:hypothetical protein